MQFSDTTAKQGLIQDIDFWLFGNSDSINTAYTVADRTRRINQRLNKVISIIFKVDRRWKFDDFNQDDTNIFYTTIVSGQQDYEVSGADFLTISEVAVKDSEGKYQILSPVVREGNNAQSLSDLEDGDAGMPLYYEKYANSIFLYPKPSTTYVTASAGLMVRGKRLPSYFLYTDTDKEPGFNPLYHEYLSIGASYDYALANGMGNKVSQLQPEIERLEYEIENSYKSRTEDEKPRMSLEGTDDYRDNLY